MRTKGLAILAVMVVVVTVLFMGWRASEVDDPTVEVRFKDTLDAKKIEEQKLVRYLEQKEKMMY